MAEINAGVVLVTKFVSSDSAVFSGYIDYINRSNAVRNDNIDKYTIPTLENEIKQYNEYMDYMGDAKKTTELFTNNKDRLSITEKEKLKNIYQLAQDNNSLMWQTVISFDNKWLADNGLYDIESGVLQETKLKEYTRLAMNTMLTKEGMDLNSLWSSAIHYNTDNIHIHIATVQPKPNREMKTIKTIRFKDEWIKQNINSELLSNLDIDHTVKAHKSQNKNYAELLKQIKENILSEVGVNCKLGDYVQLNTDGSVDVSYYGENTDIPYMATLQSEKQVQKGIFKESSIEAAKSRMVNNILNQNLINNKINNLMRDTLIDDFKNINADNRDLKKLYFNIYQSLPKNKRLWQYNNNVISPLRSSIDGFTTEWIKQNHLKDYEILNEYLSEQEKMYQTAYGGNHNNFADNKIKDLYSRCGNIILKNLKELAKSDLLDLNDIEESSSLPDINISEITANDTSGLSYPGLSNSENIVSDNYNMDSKFSEEEISEYLFSFEEITWNLTFSENYKKAKRALYGTKDTAPDHQLAFELLEEEAHKGNIYAIYDLASCYQKGLGCVANSTIANLLYNKALAGFHSELLKAENTTPKNKKDENRLINRINSLKYRIGKMHYYGQGTEINKKTAFEFFIKSSDYLYSKFYLAKFYENGEKGVVIKNSEIAFNYYNDICTDCEMTGKSMPYAYYKTAYMIENGIGTSIDEESAYKFYKKSLKEFELSIEERPDDFLLYRIGTMYLNGKGCKENITTAIDYLEQAVKGGNDMAACTLAMVYIKNNIDEPEKINKAYELLHNSADNNNNATAQFNLGKLYLENIETEKQGVNYLILSAEQDNQFAQYTLGSYFFKNEETKEDGIYYLTKSAEQDNPFAQYKFGKYYLDDTDQKELGIDYLSKSAKQNNQFAQYKLGAYYLDQGDTQIGIDYLSASAEQENQFAQYKLGSYYLDQGDIEKGTDYLLASAKQENSFAQYTLGKYYLEETDQKELGIDYLSKSAEQNNPFAQYKLGAYYLDQGDTQKGIECLLASAEQENQFAQCKLGLYYLENNDIENGISYLEAAAKQNNTSAKFKLSSYYLKSGDINKGLNYLLELSNNDNVFANIKLGNFYSQADYFDFKEAEKYYLKAVGKGVVAAEYNLGVLYLSDRNNINHVLKGIDYLETAANQGNSYALYQLGKVYFYGNKFITPDREKAKTFLKAAVEQGHKGAEYLLSQNNKSPRRKISLPHFHLPYELNQSFYKLLSELGRDYRNQENIRNQIEYNKLQRKIEEDRL